MLVFVKYYRQYRFNFKVWWHRIILTAFGAAPQVFQLFFSPQPSARPPLAQGLRSQPDGEVGFDC